MTRELMDLAIAEAIECGDEFLAESLRRAAELAPEGRVYVALLSRSDTRGTFYEPSGGGYARVLTEWPPQGPLTFATPTEQWLPGMYLTNYAFLLSPTGGRPLAVCDLDQSARPIVGAKLVLDLEAGWIVPVKGKSTADRWTAERVSRA